jgi:Zn-dependent protease
MVSSSTQRRADDYRISRCYAAERHMIEFRLFGFPVRILPWFFLTAALIGPRDLGGLAIWVPVVLTGVLAHELGHAMAIRGAGGSPVIQLHGFGGATSWRYARSIGTARRIGISAAGPAVGLLIGLIAIVVARMLPLGNPVLDQLLRYVVWVNLGWGLLNLLPVLPLDGGMIVGTLAEAAWGRSGRDVARWVSLVLCIVLAVMALMADRLWYAIIAGVLALVNLQAIRARTR